MAIPIFRGMYPAGQDEGATGSGKRPVILDILAPDLETSMLPDGIKLVLYVNPNSISIKHDKTITAIQTRGGFVEQHWGDNTQGITLEMATGGFKRLYTGLIGGITSPALTGGTRRETLAYDSYLDLLALFHNNASIYDMRGQVVAQGQIKLTFDGGVYLGWFSSFSVTESADQPYRFTMSGEFTVAKELQTWRSVFSATTQEDPWVPLTNNGQGA